MSANPVLTVETLAGPPGAQSMGGIGFAFFTRYGAREVDAAGINVPNGFECRPYLSLDAGPTNCETTQRFVPGAVVRLRAIIPVGPNTSVNWPASPSWSGCDAISGDICTVTITGARTVTVTSVATA
jgi:hypothetical protein